MPEDRTGQGHENKLPALPHRRQEIIQKKEHAGDQEKIQNGKELHHRSPCDDPAKGLHQSPLDDDGEDEAEENEGLNEGKCQGEQEFLLFALYEPLGAFAEHQLERRAKHCEQPGREDKKEDKTQGP